MRYERGKGKYWLPDPGKGSRQPLLKPSDRDSPSPTSYGAVESDGEEVFLSPDEERLYEDAKQLEFGDWNYPVITAHTATRESILYRDPAIITSSTNRNVLQPSRLNKKKRKSRIENIQEQVNKGKGKSDDESKSKKPPLKQTKSGSSSGSANRDQLVDLVVEDEEAEEIERVRARKEGSPRWNEAQPKHFVRTYPANEEAEYVREGYAPDKVQPNQPHDPEHLHNLDQPIKESEETDGDGGDQDQRMWEDRAYSDHEQDNDKRSPRYGSFAEERGVWGEDGSGR